MSLAAAIGGARQRMNRQYWSAEKANKRPDPVEWLPEDVHDVHRAEAWTIPYMAIARGTRLIKV